MASASTSSQSASHDNSNASLSHFRKTVCLQDWWLIKAEKDVDGRRLAIAGLTAREQQAIRVFSSAPICKRYDVFTLETVDGICVIIKGFINKVRTEENGFPFEVFDHFVFGFPPYWEAYAQNCFGGGSRSDAVSKSNVGLYKLSSHSIKEHGVMASAQGQYNLEDDTCNDCSFEVLKACTSQVVPEIITDDTSDSQNHVIGCVEGELNLHSGSGVATMKSRGGRDSLTSKDESHPEFTACSLTHVHPMENDNSENLSLLISSGRDTVSSLKVDMVMQQEPSGHSEIKSSKNICISKGSGKLNKRTPILSKSNLNISNSRVSMDGAPVESLSLEGSHVDNTDPIKFNKVMSRAGTSCVSHNTRSKCSGSSERSKKDNANDKLKNGSKSLSGTGAAGKLHGVNSSTTYTVGLKGAQNETLPATNVAEEPKYLFQSEKCVDYTMKHATVPPVLAKNNDTPSKVYMNVNAPGSTVRKRNSELKSLGGGQKKSPVCTYSAEHKNRKRGLASEAFENMDAQKLNINSPVTAAYHKCGMKFAVDKKGSDTKEARTSKKKTKRKLTYETPTSLEQEERTSVASPESLCCKRSRSGRLLLPTLEFWRNQTAIYDADRRITGIHEWPCAVKLSRGSKSEPQRKQQ